jgi:hypothetical protein
MISWYVIDGSVIYIKKGQLLRVLRALAWCRLARVSKEIFANLLLLYAVSYRRMFYSSKKYLLEHVRRTRPWDDNPHRGSRMERAQRVTGTFLSESAGRAPISRTPPPLQYFFLLEKTRSTGHRRTTDDSGDAVYMYRCFRDTGVQVQYSINIVSITKACCRPIRSETDYYGPILKPGELIFVLLWQVQYYSGTKKLTFAHTTVSAEVCLNHQHQALRLILALDVNVVIAEQQRLIDADAGLSAVPNACGTLEPCKDSA